MKNPVLSVISETDLPSVPEWTHQAMQSVHLPRSAPVLWRVPVQSLLSAAVHRIIRRDIFPYNCDPVQQALTVFLSLFYLACPFLNKYAAVLLQCPRFSFSDSDWMRNPEKSFAVSSAAFSGFFETLCFYRLGSLCKIFLLQKVYIYS